ncbi:MAG: hypothetical protein QG553_699 [Patescibacteria group bacterium]|nr:hypothetical protein [Patescibacteria group bacterium]
MNPEAPLPPDTVENSIEGISEGETLLYEVRRHTFGLIVVYGQVGIGFLAGSFMLMFLAPIMFPNEQLSQLRLFLSVVIGLIAIAVWMVLMLYTYIYRQSKLIISNKNLTQVLQHGLFNRKVSELSLANVEDVTAKQRGILASIFGFGNLIVETAGEQANFDFKYCPRPNFYGKVVLDARQKYLDSDPTRNRRR